MQDENTTNFHEKLCHFGHRIRHLSNFGEFFP